MDVAREKFIVVEGRREITVEVEADLRLIARLLAARAAGRRRAKATAIHGLVIVRALKVVVQASGQEA